MPDLKYKLDKSDIVSFAYLFKQLNFERKFTVRKSKNFLFNEKPAPSFYVDEEDQRKQIKVGYYKNSSDFCINIADRLTSDVLYLIKSE